MQTTGGLDTVAVRMPSDPTARAVSYTHLDGFDFFVLLHEVAVEIAVCRNGGIIELHICLLYTSNDLLQRRLDLHVLRFELLECLIAVSYTHLNARSFSKKQKTFFFFFPKASVFSLGADVAKVFFEAKGESADGGGVLCADIAQDKIIAFKAGFILFSGGIAEHLSLIHI